MFLALRDLSFARGRFGLMAGVIGLITVLVVLLSGLTAGLSNQSVSAITSLPANRLSFAEPANGQDVSFNRSRVDSRQVEAVASQHGVRAATPLGVAPTGLEVGGHEVQVSAFGVEPGGFLAPVGLSGDSVTVSAALASDRGIAVGDTVRIGGHAYAVGATKDDSSFNHLPVVWIPLHAWQELEPGAGATATVVAAQTDDTFDAAALDADAGLWTTDLGGALAAVGSYSAENGSLALMRGLLLVVSALVVGAFFTVWTMQRSPDLAVLKAIGASTAYLMRDALAQALVVLLLGGGVGTLVAAGLGWFASDVVPFVVSWDTTVVPFGGLLAVGLLGAAASLRQIATVDPLTALGAAR